MTLERSDVDGIYGTVNIEDDVMRIMFTDIPDHTRPPGITIVSGVGSMYRYFIFVPVEVYDAVADVLGESSFDIALIELCERLYQAET